VFGGSPSIGRTATRAVQPQVMKVEPEQNVFGGPWALPVVRIGPTQYFADLRLREFRDVSNPGNCVNFESEPGRRMCEQTGIIVCQECKTSVIVSTALNRDELRRMNCLALVVPRVRL
jgi:hypothetical protein